MVDFNGFGQVGGVLPHPIEGDGAGGGRGDTGFATVAVCAIGEDGSEELVIRFVVGAREQGDEGGAIGVWLADFIGEPVASLAAGDGKGGVPGSGEGSQSNHVSKVAWWGGFARKK